MTHRKKLQEQYEEAVFALLIDEVTEQERQELLAEAQRLNRDPDAAIPKELDRKCRRIIRGAARKEKRKTTGRVTVKVIQRVAVVVLAAALLFGIAYAAIPEFRVGVLNLVLEVTEVSTNLKLKPGCANTAEPAFDSVVYCYGVPQIPGEYGLDFAAEEETARFYSYKNKDGDFIQVNFFLGDIGTNMGIDTEDAQTVTHVVVNGYEGICVEKNGTVQVAWADTDRQVFASLYCTALDKKTVLEMTQAMKYTPPGSAETAEPAFDSAIYSYGFPQIPEGYELDYVAEEEIDRFYSYKNGDGDVIQVDFYQGSSGTNMGIDTEDAQAVTHVVVNGYEGICVEKNGTVQVVWLDTDTQVLPGLYCTALDKNTVLEMAKAMKYTPPGT